MSTNEHLAFVDVETTGLDANRHEIWELAIVYTDDAGREGRYEAQLPVDLAVADPDALRIGRFYERRRALSLGNAANLKRERFSDSSAEGWIAGMSPSTVANILDGKHLVGACPWFDAAFLSKWLRANGQAATWHYHLIDVEALAVGYLAGQGTNVHLPWDSEHLSRMVGVEPLAFERHTALGDALWAKAIYEAVTRWKASE